jgi:hypothetical protein
MEAGRSGIGASPRVAMALIREARPAPHPGQCRAKSPRNSRQKHRGWFAASMLSPDGVAASRSEQRTDNKPKTRLDRKSPIQVRIHFPPIVSLRTIGSAMPERLKTDRQGSGERGVMERSLDPSPEVDGPPPPARGRSMPRTSALPRPRIEWRKARFGGGSGSRFGVKIQGGDRVALNVHCPKPGHPTRRRFQRCRW